MTITTTTGEAVAENVKTLMRLRGIRTHAELADRMSDIGFEWERRTVGRILTDSRSRHLKVDEVVALALALQTTVEELLLPDLEGRIGGGQPRGLVAIGNLETIPASTYTALIRTDVQGGNRVPPETIPEVTTDEAGRWKLSPLHEHELKKKERSEQLDVQLEERGIDTTDMTFEDKLIFTLYGGDSE